MVSGDHLHGAHLFSFSLWANLGSNSLEQPWEGCSKDKDSGIILVSRANRSKSSDDNGDDNGENQTLTVGLPFPSKFPNIPWNRCYFLLYKDDQIAAKGGKVACSSHT